jgi:uncharacterized protein (TIGR02246 family)
MRRSEDEAAVRARYGAIIDGWNADDAAAFAAPFARDGVVIGFDGSEIRGRKDVEAAMAAVFADHETGTYVGSVRSVRPLAGGDAMLLQAVAGVVPAGEDDLKPDLNSAQALVAERDADGAWAVVLYQNTPAQYHGRPEAAAALTEELRAERRGAD